MSGDNFIDEKAAEVYARDEAAFLSEVERRAGATRKEMLAAFDRITAHSDPAPILIDWLRLILGEKP